MQQLSILFSLMNPSKSEEDTACADVSRCSSTSGDEVQCPAKNLPRTFEAKPDGEPERAPNRERRVWNACATCGLWYAARACRLERGQGICCSRECWEKHVIAAGVFKGANNPRWLGGVSNDNMRYRRRQMEREPVKEAARRATQYAIRMGTLVRQPCEQCGATPGHAHHDDYSKPLDVRWLCRPCHTEHHKQERASRRAG